MRKTTTCAFYEVNLDELEYYQVYIDSLFVDERSRCLELEQYLSTVNTICSGCGEFCKHLSVENGPMYETLYLCQAPGNEHIIGAESDDAEEMYGM